MIVYVYKPIKYNPIILLVSKINKPDELELIENMADELFNYLIEENYANLTNILLISIIKDYDKTTESLVIPSINTNKEIINYCEFSQFTNIIIVETIESSNTLFYFDITNKIKIYNKQLNLGFLGNYYKLV
jgi:hypothetical protein